MKKTIALIVLSLLLVGCSTATNADQAKIKELEAKISQQEAQITALQNEKANLQKILDTYDPNIGYQNTMMYTAISLLFTSQATCTAVAGKTNCLLPANNATLVIPIVEMPRFMVVLNPSPDKIFVIYYDDLEMMIYSTFTIVLSSEVDAILAQVPLAKVVKNLADNKVLIQFASDSMDLSNPTAIDNYTKQFIDKLSGNFDYVEALPGSNG
jgi:outer membrane murein-binding lipoprotein Lpp